MANPGQFAFRTSKTIGLFETDPVYGPVSSFQQPEGNLRCCAYSPCGSYFAWASPESVAVVEAPTGLAVATFAAANVFELGFSPLGTYLITWKRPSKDEAGDAAKNLVVWNLAQARKTGPEGSVVGRFVQKSQTGWNLQYTRDERYCARTVTNTVQFFQSKDLGSIWSKIHVEGVTNFALSPSGSNTVAVFVPERKVSGSHLSNSSSL